MNPQFKDKIDYLLQEWVNTPSHFDDTAGVQVIQNLIEAEATPLRLYSEYQKDDASPSVPIQLVSLIPQSEQNAGLFQIELTAKAYTHFDQNSSLQMITWAGGRNRAIGPGVLSSRSGILIALLLMQKAQKIKNAQFNINLKIFAHPQQQDAYWQKKPPVQLLIPLDPSEPDRSVRYNAPAESIAKISARLIEHHEKKTPQQLTLLPGLGSSQDPPTVIGLGPIGTGSHTAQETLEVTSIFSRADILNDVLVNLLS